MFVYSSYHLNISFPSSGSHFNKLERVLETLKNGFVSTVTLWITLNKTKNITNNFTKLITNIKNNNHASINYDASIETLATARSTAYIPISFLGNYRGYINENYYCTTDSRNRKFQTQKNPSIIPVTWNPEYPPPPPGDLHGTSFQSSPKINRMLITTLICIRWTLWLNMAGNRSRFSKH